MPEETKRFIPQWGTPPVPLDIQESEIAKQLALIDSLRVAAEAGTIAAISVVVLRANFVPEHAFSVVPYSAAILAAGMDMALDDLKSKAREVMMQPVPGQPVNDALPDELKN